jgi:hypothetical protein
LSSQTLPRLARSTNQARLTVLRVLRPLRAVEQNGDAVEGKPIVVSNVAFS